MEQCGCIWVLFERPLMEQFTGSPHLLPALLEARAEPQSHRKKTIRRIRVRAAGEALQPDDARAEARGIRLVAHGKPECKIVRGMDEIRCVHRPMKSRLRGILQAGTAVPFPSGHTELRVELIEGAAPCVLCPGQLAVEQQPAHIA